MRPGPPIDGGTWLYQLWNLDPWTDVPSFSNSWVNVGGSYYDAAYYIDNYNIVRMRGRISSGTSGTTAFQLPVGYRTTKQMEFAVDDSGAVAKVTIDASGNVIPTATGATPTVSLETITFRADA